MAQLNFSAIRLIAESLSSRLPIRISHIYVAYEPWFFDQAYAIIKYAAAPRVSPEHSASVFTCQHLRIGRCNAREPTSQHSGFATDRDS